MLGAELSKEIKFLTLGRRGLKELATSNNSGPTKRVLASPFVFIPTSPYVRLVTGEDLFRWRAAYKSEVRVVIGRGSVEVMAPSELARKYKTTVSQLILVAQQQGYTVLDWDQYRKLLDEIGSLIGEDKESLPGTIVGIPVTTTDSPQEVKVLPKNSSL